MNTVRYLVALLVLLSIPSSFVLWSLIHLFASFWRKFGFFRTYAILSVPVGGLMVGMFNMRDTLLSIDFGLNIKKI